MAITDDIAFYYSGTGTQSGSLGGAISTTAIPNSVNDNIFNSVGSSEAVSGSDKYRCIYMKNNGAVTYNTGIYLSTQTPSKDTEIYFAKGTAAKNTSEQSVVDENTEPAGVIWTARVFSYNALLIDSLAPGDYISWWLKRNVVAYAGGSLSDYFILTPVVM